MPRSREFDKTVVLEKARDLFWEKGYTATSIYDLEKALGIRRSSIYNTFGGKRELYNQTLRGYQNFNQEVLKNFLLGADNLRCALKELFSRIVDIPEDQQRGCYIMNATTELAAVDSEVLQFSANNREIFVGILKKALQQAQDQKELQPNSNLDAQANYLFVWYNGLQVVSQTAVPARQLRAAIERAIDGLEWTKNPL